MKDRDPYHNQRISEALKGRKKDPTHIENISKGVASRWKDPEYRQKVMEGLARRPKVIPQEVRDKISATKKLRNAERRQRE